jgi:hypothetical protein
MNDSFKSKKLKNELEHYTSRIEDAFYDPDKYVKFTGQPFPENDFTVTVEYTHDCIRVTVNSIEEGLYGMYVITWDFIDSVLDT